MDKDVFGAGMLILPSADLTGGDEGIREVRFFADTNLQEQEYGIIPL